MSFLLSLFFTVSVSSTLGFLSLPLHWVFFAFSFHQRRFLWVGLLLCLASSLWGPNWGCFSQVKSKLWHHRCRGVCNFLSSVSLQQKFEVMDRPALQPSDGPVLQLSIIDQFYLESKEKYILEAEGMSTQKIWREERPLAQFWLRFLYVSSPGPALCKLGYPGVLFVLPEILTPVRGPSFVLFSQAFPFLIF